MVLVEPPRPRYDVSELPGKLVITLPFRGHWFAIAFLGFWLVGWAVGEVVVLTILVTGFWQALQNGFAIGPGGWGIGAFLFAWLGGWTVGGAFAIYSWLWNIGGREIVEIDDLVLRIEKRIPGLCRAREYRVSDVACLRHAPQPGNPWAMGPNLQQWGSSAGAFAFDYGASTVRFGIGVDEAEAKQVMVVISQRFPKIVDGINKPG